MIPIMIGQTDYDINMMWASLAFCLPASYYFNKKRLGHFLTPIDQARFTQHAETCSYVK